MTWLVHTDKFRVTVGDRKEANEIVAYEIFTLQYVYLSSPQVEMLVRVTGESMKITGKAIHKNVAASPVLLYLLSRY